MKPPFTRDRVTWLAYLLLAFYSYFINSFGPIAPFLKDELHLSYTISSLHFSGFAVGILLVGLFGQHLILRVGRWRSLWIGAFGISLSTVLLLAGRTPLVTIGASFLMGLIGSLILVIIPSLLADRHGELRAIAISEANMLSSLVAAAAPLMVGWAVRVTGSWRLALALVALIPVLLRLGLGKVSLHQVGGNQNQPAGRSGSLPILYWLFWVALVLSVAVEFCMISWSADYLATGLGMAKVSAAQAVSLFLVAMIIGRWAGSRLLQSFAPFKLIMASLLIAAVGFLVFWKAGSVLVGVSGLFLTGLGVASLYPLIISLAIGAANGDTVQASVRATLASGLAILSLPLVLGRLADIVGIRQAYGVVAVLLVCAFLIIQFALRLSPAAHPVTQ